MYNIIGTTNISALIELIKLIEYTYHISIYYFYSITRIEYEAVITRRMEFEKCLIAWKELMTTLVEYII